MYQHRFVSKLLQLAQRLESLALTGILQQEGRCFKYKSNKCLKKYEMLFIIK